MTGKNVINEGICGHRSYDGVRRIDGVLSRHHPGVILIDYGINDLFYSGSSIIVNLRTMIDAARKNKTLPIVATLLRTAGDYDFLNPAIDATNGSIRALCMNEKIQCADLWRAFARNEAFVKDPFALLSRDGLHPNDAGYRVIAETWRGPLLSNF